MITVTITPRYEDDNLFRLLVQKELDLRRAGRGTLHRHGPKKKNQEKWVHASYKGWINFQKALGGTVVAVIQPRGGENEWQMVTSFVGFLYRHFRKYIASVNLSFEEEDA
ncbi:MAG: hypothetical protein IH877_03280 [Gemmatimonadetes bacterium]|nr:hypothetical protein [Gemmatimonadota bacterium]